MRSAILLVAATACAASQRPPAPERDPGPPAFRLPDGVRPTAYRVDLTLRPGEERFDGRVEIDLELARPLRTIWLHGERLEVTEVTVAGRPAKARAVAPSWLGLDVDSAVGPGPATVVVTYRGTINKGSGTGIFAGTLDGETYLYTHFQAPYARQAFPCLDEPGFKAPWTITLRIPEDQLAASNAPIAAERREGGLRVVSFAPTRPLPSYLIALTVGRFDVVDGGRAGRGQIPVRFLVPRGQAANGAYVARMMGRAIEWFETYLDMAYPYPKLDLVATVAPLVTYGAMENAGLITSCMEHVLPNAGLSVSFRTTATDITVHEVSHHWFGDLVTPAWWDDLWLNESFAEWITEKAVRELEPSLLQPSDRIDARVTAVSADLSPSAEPIRRRVVDGFGLTDVFDGISYNKGHVVLAMVERWIGPDRFRQAVRAHLRAHVDGVADTDEFFAAVQRAADRDVKPVLASFVDRAGVPLVRGEVACDAGGAHLRLEQSRLGLPGAAAESRPFAIPMCIRYGGGARKFDECFLIEGPRVEHRLSVCPDWTVLNAGNDGYYVAALDPGGLERSIAARAALEPIDLLGLIADLRALVRMGAFQLGDALRLTEPLLAGADPALRKSILDLERQARVYARDDQLEALDRVLLARGGAAARALGVTPREGDSPDVVELRRGLLGFLGGEVGDRELSAMAVAPLRRWLTDRSGIDRADLYWIPPLAARHGDAELLAALETVGRNAAVPDQEVVAYTIPAFGDPELVRKGYQWMMAGGLSDEVLTWVHTGGRYPGREARRAVFEEHLDALIARTPAEQQVWLIRVAGWNICDAEGRAWLERVYRARAAKIPNGAETYKERLAEIDQCIAVAPLHQPGLGAWLKGR